MNIFNKSFMVDMALNRYLIPENYIVEDVDEEGVRHKVESNSDKCYFQGTIAGDPSSKVSLSLCQDDMMVGAYTLKRE